MFSILHISDLHRSRTDPISNAELISALLSDRNRYRYETPAIKAPDAIVVSGDIIQGVPLGEPDAADKLEEQYGVAEQFLNDLTERFVGGDKSKIVIVPGNHDMDWVISRAAMQPVPPDKIPKDLPALLGQPDSNYRWDWKERILYEIIDRDAYERRLKAFQDFMARFYRGTSGILRLRPDEASLFSLCDGRIGIAAFNSCHGNDCYAFHGRISPEVIAQAYLDLTDPPHQFELLIGVWHHNIEGPPYHTDYMDADIVRGMIGRGYRVGLFGHQHKPEAVLRQIQLSAEERMAVIGAGSLCAGKRDLPTGHFRGYNVIEIADDMRSARVHFREMSVANVFGRSPQAAFGGNSWTELKWEAPADLMGRTPDYQAKRLRNAIEAAEHAARSGDCLAAIGILEPLRTELPDYGKKLLVEATRDSGNLLQVIEILTPPSSISELIELVECCLKLRDFHRAKSALGDNAKRLGLNSAHKKELLNRIDAEQEIAR